MAEYIFINILFQTIYIVGLIFLTGFIISIMNRLFYKLLNGNKTVCYVTGFLGTPVHELSHALMCLIFMHKIEGIKLFQIDSENGVLGYVNHSYNKKNLWAVIGNYFIGVAPIFCGSILVYFMVRYLLPQSYEEINVYIQDFMILLETASFADSFSYLVAMSAGIVKSMLTGISEGGYWWLFMILVMCLALHMNLSEEDIKCAVSSVALIIVILIIVNLILGFAAQSAYSSYVLWMNAAGGFLAGTMTLSIMYSIAYVLMALSIKGGAAIVGKFAKK